MKRPHHRHAGKQAFTLVELLIAMSITSVVILILLTIVGQSTDTYTRTQRAVNNVSESRAFMHFFEREISSRLPQTPIVHEKGNNQTPAASDKIAFIRTITADEQSTTTPGDLGTSAYCVLFSPTIGNAVTPRLYRKSLDPTETQKILNSQQNPAFPTVDLATGEPILDNILAFQARPKFLDPTTGTLKDWTNSSPQPASAIEIIVRFIDESSARRFKTEQEWNRLAASPTDKELPIIQTFSRTITIAK